ncbi:alanine/glycine:cation symporter family protein [Indiicoccus explosivorum]|uniref:alanine/glycine:cation symporter family protein n=1 Tax=Indiicoccus explosivorum TaxID=1917864 RepID=UPI000B43EB0A|nr:sodium:alanine symporter family protein [Indiicoccus explosivorum]
MVWLEDSLTWLSGVLWGVPALILIVGTGIFLTIRLGLVQLRLLPDALKLVFSPSKQDKSSEGDISHFAALTTAMAATVGTGNIVGVAAAIALGGPGALFWMWVSAFFGMATKYGEAVLAVKYRITDDKGEMAGGPMYYLERGLKQKWLGVLFAIFGAVAAFGIGNTVQSNAVATTMENTFGVSPWITAIVLTVFAALVIIGGIKTIGKVTAYFVPIMAIFYIAAGLIVMIMNFSLVPEAFGIVFSAAFTGEAAAGGAIGAAIRYGVARGVFSNEAGLGSAPIAAAAAKTDLPGRQALVSMTQVLFDTLIICSITGLTIVMSGLYGGGLNVDDGILTNQAFGFFLGDIGPILVTIGLLFFASSTIVGWAYYGEKCFQYLFRSSRLLVVYRIVYVAFVFVGAVVPLGIVWLFADVMNAAMAIPNLIGLLGLSGVIVVETKRITDKIKAEKSGTEPVDSAVEQ